MITDFFDSQTKHSLVKARIVSKCFFAWAKVMVANKQRYPSLAATTINYIDLYAGRGRYQDGSLSTPLLILADAASDPKMASILVSHFNDKDEKNCTSLSDAIQNLDGIENLTYHPKVYNGEVDTSIQKAFEAINMAPTFFFLDPWGYKGLSLTLIKSLVKHWGTDGVFFFSYNSIRRGLSIKSVEQHMFALFGQERVQKLRQAFQGLDAKECEKLICTELDSALKAEGAKYTLFFRFKHPTRNRTSHYLIFVTKDFLGYSIMKDIMAKEGLSLDDIPLFYYDSDAHGCQEQHQTLMFDEDPLATLETQLLTTFTKCSLVLKQIYSQHTQAHQMLFHIRDKHIIGSPFLERHYKRALLDLEAKGLISFSRQPKKKGTLAPDILITFP